jgi:hypothetical protein
LITAPYLVLSADKSTVKDFCRRMTSQFAETKDAREARLTVKVCSLVPDTLDDKLPLDTFIKSVDGPSAGGNAWSWSVRAMYAYRKGDAKSVIEYVEKSHALRHGEYVKAANLPIAAMAHHQLGNHQAATTAMKEAAQVLQRLEADQKSYGYEDLAIAQILYREAESKIGDKETKQ